MSDAEALYAAIVRMHEHGVDCGDLLGSRTLAGELAAALLSDAPGAQEAPQRLRPGRGTCPGCGAAENRWCAENCPLTDPYDMR